MRAVEKRLRVRIKALEQELKTVKEDREKLRNHFSNRLKWWLELLGSNNKPDLKSLIESDAKFMWTLERWYWW